MVAAPAGEKYGRILWANGGPLLTMPHEIAKLLLEHSETLTDRVEAVRLAVRLGMPLDEIEEYLDWLELVRSRQPERRREEPPRDG